MGLFLSDFCGFMSDFVAPVTPVTPVTPTAAVFPPELVEGRVDCSIEPISVWNDAKWDEIFVKIDSSMNRRLSRRVPSVPFRLRPLHFSVCCSLSFLFDTIATVLTQSKVQFHVLPHISLVQLHGAVFSGEVWVYRSEPGPELVANNESHPFVVEISRHGGEDGFFGWNLFQKLHRTLCPDQFSSPNDQEILLGNDNDDDAAAVANMMDEGVPLDDRHYDDLIR